MENQKISIQLTLAQWNIVMQGVGNLPFSQVADIIPDIKAQAEAQLKAAGEAVEAQPS